MRQPDASSTTLTRRDFLLTGALLGAGVMGVGVAGAVPAAPREGPSDPLTARVTHDGDRVILGNMVIAGVWSVTGGRFRAVRIVDHMNESELPLPSNAFTLLLADGSAIAASDLTAGPLRVSALTAAPGAARKAERVSGQQLSVALRDEHGRVRVEWRALLRDGSRYLRQEVAVHALGQPLAVRELVMLDGRVPNPLETGTVKGSPIVSGHLYLGVEHPLSENKADGDGVRCALPRELPVRPGTALVVSSVIGVARAGQMRREFLGYVERERAHPYRPYLHYNSWYDIGFFSSYGEHDALAVIDAVGAALVEARQAPLRGWMFDDGWDDPKTLWAFNAGFPHGFSAVRAAAAKYRGSLGVWLSPWGGYGEPKQERLRSGKEHGYEMNDGGFALSGPRYYARFRERCLHMMRDYGVAQFKFDGTGNAAAAIPGSAFDSDFDAAIHLIGELRSHSPDLYVNLTTGTYASPFWLRYADSVWRGGEDHDFAGVGSRRQQWITYRDAQTFANVARAGTLFPLNALMLHGVIFAQHAKHLSDDPQGDFDAEVRSYFGSGTQLQEMYITPSLLSPAHWDVLAECALWSKRNASTLVDTHWVGGDPAHLDVYGWASWSPACGILTLRNPADRAQGVDIDVARVFELPDDAPRDYVARSPWKRDRARAPVQFRAGKTQGITLQPFEVLTLQSGLL